jgi:hypothetical protein
VLQTALPCSDDVVTDLRYRASIAAQINAVIREIQAARQT